MRVDSPYVDTRPGDVANLLLGFRWEGDGERPGAALFTTGCVPLTRGSVEPVMTAETVWGPPVVTLHRDAEALADRLVPHRIMPFKRDPPDFDLPSGALLWEAGDAERTRRQLERTTGLDLRPGLGFMLIQMRRVSGRAEHEVLASPPRRGFDPALHLTAEGRRRQSCLLTGRLLGQPLRGDLPLTRDIAEGYLRYFYEVGTHLVSAVVFGDQLFQVFAYAPEVFAELSRAWQALGLTSEARGIAALAWAPFTAAERIAQRGQLVSLAGDPALTQSLAGGHWHDPRYARGDSLFHAHARGLDGGAVFLAPFAEQRPFAVELTPISRFMEPERSVRFEQVLRGALEQRCHGRARLELPRSDSQARALARGSTGEATPATAATPRLFQEHLDLVGRTAPDDPTFGGEVVDIECCAARVLHLQGPGRIVLPARTVVAYRISAATRTHDAARIHLAPDGRVPLSCAQMTGALWLVHEDEHIELVVDGLRFTTGAVDAATDRRRVALAGDLHTRDPATHAGLGPAIAAALVHCAQPLSARWPDPERQAESAGFATWLASFTESTDGPRWLRARAHHTAYVLHGLPPGSTADAGFVPADPEVTAMAAAALALETQEHDHLARIQHTRSDLAASQRPLWIEHHQRLRRARDALTLHNRRRLEGQLGRLERRTCTLSIALAEARAELQGRIEGLWPLVDPRPEPALGGLDLRLALETAALRFEDGTPLAPDSALARALRPQLLRRRRPEPRLGALTRVPLAATRLVALANALDAAARSGEPPEPLSAAFESSQGSGQAPGPLLWDECHAELRAIVDQQPAPPAMRVALSALLAAHRRLCEHAPRWLAARLTTSRLRLCLWHHRVPGPLAAYEAEIAASDLELAIAQERRRIVAVLVEVLADQDAALFARGVPPAPGVTPTLGALARALPWQDRLLANAERE